MNRRQTSTHTSHDRWLVSYADFITLLFAFFVVMYASAQVDQHRIGKLAMAIQAAFQEMGVFQSGNVNLTANLPERLTTEPAPRKPSAQSFSAAQDVEQLKKELELALAPEIANQEVAVHMEPEGLVLSLRELGFFDSGSASMRPQAQGAFAKLAHVLGQHPYKLRIEGHTDNIPIHNDTFHSNWELSTARATEVVRLMITRYSFSATNLSAAGYAEYHPVATNATAQGRQVNRRVDVVVLTAKPVAKAQTLNGVAPANRQKS